MAVAGPGLEAQEGGEVLGPGGVDLAQEGDGFVVVVAAAVLPEPGAADDVGGGDAGVDGEGDVGVGDGRLVVSEAFDGPRPPTRTAGPWRADPLWWSRCTARF